MAALAKVCLSKAIDVQMVKYAYAVNRSQILDQSEIVDAGAHYTSSAFARCPLCSGESFITRQERGSAYNKAIFRCSSCFHQFEPQREAILWI